MLRKHLEEKREQRGVTTTEGERRLTPDQQVARGFVLAAGCEQRWRCLHRGRGIIPTPGDVSDILFIRKEPFSIPHFPEKKGKSKRKKNLLCSLKANVPT